MENINMVCVCATMEKYSKMKPKAINRTVTFHLRQTGILQQRLTSTNSRRAKVWFNVLVLMLILGSNVVCQTTQPDPSGRVRVKERGREEGRTHESAGHLASGPHLEPDALSRRAARRISLFLKKKKKKALRGEERGRL